MTDVDSSHTPLKNVDPATISVWRWEGVLLATIAAIGSAIPLAPLSPVAAVLAAIVVASAGLAIAWFWAPARYARLQYAVDESGLTVQYGVLWRTQISLPRVRIQHSDVSQGPLQRRYGIATLKLYTAGSRYTKIEVEGLHHADALDLRDALLNRVTPHG
jgi:uncharacterized protein